MAIRDVTPAIRVDTDVDDPDTPADAETRIRAGLNTVVGSDEAAIEVLQAFGLTPDEAAERIKTSYGPLA